MQDHTNAPNEHMPQPVGKESSHSLKYIVGLAFFIAWTGLVGFVGYQLKVVVDYIEGPEVEDVDDELEDEALEPVDGEVLEGEGGESIPIDDIFGTYLDDAREENLSSCFYLRDSEGLGAEYDGMAIEDFGDTVRSEIDDFLGQSFATSIEDELEGFSLYSICELAGDYYVLANSGENFYKTHTVGRLNFESPLNPIISNASVVGSGPEPYLFAIGSGIFLHTGYGDAGFITSRYYRFSNKVFEEVQSCSSSWDADEDGNETTYRSCTKLFTVDEE